VASCALVALGRGRGRREVGMGREHADPQPAMPAPGRRPRSGRRAPARSRRRCAPSARRCRSSPRAGRRPRSRRRRGRS
jgi:hypothetical protein